AVQEGAGDDIRHGSQFRQRAVTVAAHTQVDLHDGGRSVTAGDVDEQARLDAVAGGEGQLEGGGTAEGVFARQGLVDVPQTGEQGTQQGLGREFGHTTASGGFPAESASVIGLDQVDPRIGERGGQRPDHARFRLPQIGVDEDHDVTCRGGDAPPQGLPLAGAGGDLREDLPPVERRRTRVPRPAGGGVGGVGVDDEDLVRVIGQHGGDDPGDGGLLVERRDDHRGLHARPRIVLRGAAVPAMAAVMRMTSTVSATSCARKAATPRAAAQAVAARVPGMRSPTGRSTVSPTKSLLLSAMRTGQPVATISSMRRSSSRPWKVFLPKSWVGSMKIRSSGTPARTAFSASEVVSRMTSATMSSKWTRYGLVRGMTPPVWEQT